jgi:hypothetical protein
LGVFLVNEIMNKTKQTGTVLFLMFLGIILAVFSVMISSVSINKLSTTKNKKNIALLNEIRESIYGFAMANGRLPCPATDTSDGAEAVNSPVVTQCDEEHGFVPIAQLGLSGSVDSNNRLLDVWKNPIRYSVSDVDADGIPGWDFFSENTPIASSLFPVNSTLLQIFDINSLTCNLNGSSTASNIPAIIYSLGKNGYSLNSYSATEQLNTDNNDIFVMTSFNKDNDVCGSFDDILIWIDPEILQSKLSL